MKYKDSGFLFDDLPSTNFLCFVKRSLSTLISLENMDG